jgi:bacillithiol biosynthesis cysteine-adding enzyme BshC
VGVVVLPGRLRAVGRLEAAYPPLYRDLAADPARVRAFFPEPPFAPEAWRRRAAAVHASWREPGAQRRRAQVAAALEAAHARLGTTPAQDRNLRRLAADDALVVVAGQQPGLLGGPLYTTYKALGAIRLAREAEEALGCPVVPVFWVASEDHDWSEVSRASLAGPDGRVVELRLPGSGGFRSAGSVPLPPEARHLLGALEALYPPSAAGAAWAASLRASLQGRRPTLAEWFTWQLHALLGSRGLLFYDPMWPALRAVAAPVFAGAASRAAAANAALREAGERLRAAGYTPGLDLDPDHVHLFAYVQGRRVALHLVDGRVRSRGGEVDLHPAELAERATREPTAFSPNVVLRPVVQDFTLPVLEQLGGPGEVAYLAELGAVFALWDRAAPLVGPRPGATLLTPEDVEALRRAGLEDPAELRGDPGPVLERVAAAASPVDLDAVFAAARQTVDGLYAGLARDLAPVSPHLPELVRGNHERVRYQLAYLERKAHQHRRRQLGDLGRALRAASGRLFPAGGLQERASLVHPYLFRWGEAFLDALEEALAPAATFGDHPLLAWEDG